MATVTVAYPMGVPLDTEYYLAKHAPLIVQLWSPKGLKQWRVVKNTDPTQKYSIMTFLEWDNLAGFQAASAAEESKVIFEDIKNFTKGTPEILTGEVIASS